MTCQMCLIDVSSKSGRKCQLDSLSRFKMVEEKQRKRGVTPYPLVKADFFSLQKPLAVS